MPRQVRGLKSSETQAFRRTGRLPSLRVPQAARRRFPLPAVPRGLRHRARTEAPGRARRRLHRRVRRHARQGAQPLESRLRGLAVGRRTGWFCWAIRRLSTKTYRTRSIAAFSPLMQLALPSSAATAPCRFRHGPQASCSVPMASRLRFSRPYGRDASLATTTASITTTASASMQDFCFVPLCPASVAKVSRGPTPRNCVATFCDDGR